MPAVTGDDDKPFGAQWRTEQNGALIADRLVRLFLDPGRDNDPAANSAAVTAILADLGLDPRGTAAFVIRALCADRANDLCGRCQGDAAVAVGLVDRMIEHQTIRLAEAETR
jgi:hypothetical protein